MELGKIESLLEAYFEGKTSLQEENELRAYFSGSDVDSHLEVYQALFAGLQQAQEEVSSREVRLPESTSQRTNWWYGIAAMLVVGLTVGGFFLSQPRLSHEEQMALDTFNKAKESLMLLSQNLNKGTEGLTLIDEFNKGTSSISHINQFTNTKNKILK